MVLLFVFHAAHWHWPYRPGGAWRELSLPAAALGVGVLAALLLARAAPPFRRLGAWTGGALLSLAAFVILQAADPFVGARSWRYAPPGCDFAVEFPGRASVVAGTGAARVAERVQFTDVGHATTYTAECVSFGRAVAPAERAGLLAEAEAQIKRDATRLNLKVERIAREGQDGLVLLGVADEGRTATNEPLLRRARARAVLGASSMLVLWSWSVLREGGAVPASVDRFHASVRPVAVPAR